MALNSTLYQNGIYSGFYSLRIEIDPSQTWSKNQTQNQEFVIDLVKSLKHYNNVCMFLKKTLKKLYTERSIKIVRFVLIG